MARTLLKDASPTVAEILDGKHDDVLTQIIEAAQWRMKNLFRKGMKVQLHGTKNAHLEGKIGTVLKVNPKRISVGVGNLKVEGAGTEWSYEVYEDGEYNVPPSMLTVVN